MSFPHSWTGTQDARTRLLKAGLLSLFLGWGSSSLTLGAAEIHPSCSDLDKPQLWWELHVQQRQKYISDKIVKLHQWNLFAVREELRPKEFCSDRFQRVFVVKATWKQVQLMPENRELGGFLNSFNPQDLLKIALAISFWPETWGPPSHTNSTANYVKKNWHVISSFFLLFVIQ